MNLAKGDRNQLAFVVRYLYKISANYFTAAIFLPITNKLKHILLFK